MLKCFSLKNGLLLLNLSKKVVWILNVIALSTFCEIRSLMCHMHFKIHLELKLIVIFMFLRSFCCIRCFSIILFYRDIFLPHCSIWNVTFCFCDLPSLKTGNHPAKTMLGETLGCIKCFLGVGGSVISLWCLTLKRHICKILFWLRANPASFCSCSCFKMNYTQQKLMSDHC